MQTRRMLFGFLFSCLILPTIARADYVEVRRDANAYVDSNRNTDIAFRAEVGTNLHLLESETKEGYYHVEDPKTGTQGWIYRSMVRRFQGDIPQTSSTNPQSTLGQHFPINRCKLPYNEKPEKGLAIESCGLQGNAQDKTPEAVQNPHKNDLCVTGVAQPVTISDLVKLQEEVDDSGMEYGSRFQHKSPPMDRSPLTKLPPLPSGIQLGEGSLVTFVGYLADAHYSPASSSSKGESVNCSKAEHEMADIHIALSAEPGKIKSKDPKRIEKFCRTISAEFIPHARPAIWDTSTLNQVIDLERPVRVTGQLFFDASHEPCHDGVPVGSDPRRIAGWEIHPIYTFEICKFTDMKKCDVTSTAAWQPMSKTNSVTLEEDDED
jgi:hypothetical protein